MSSRWCRNGNNSLLAKRGKNFESLMFSIWKYLVLGVYTCTNRTLSTNIPWKLWDWKYFLVSKNEKTNLESLIFSVWKYLVLGVYTHRTPDKNYTHKSKHDITSVRIQPHKFNVTLLIYALGEMFVFYLDYIYVL